MGQATVINGRRTAQIATRGYSAFRVSGVIPANALLTIEVTVLSGPALDMDLGTGNAGVQTISANIEKEEHC